MGWVDVFGSPVSRILSLGLLAALAACSSTDTTSIFSSAKKPSDTGGNDPKMVVMQGACPQVYLREGTAIYRQYTKGVKKDPSGMADQENLVVQATLDATTRQCRQTAEGLVVSVVVRGRIVTGPAGKPGTYTLPIRVAATDGDQTLYSQLSQTQVTIPPGQGSNQFIFTKDDVLLTSSGGLTRLFAGIDEGPYNTK